MGCFGAARIELIAYAIETVCQFQWFLMGILSLGDFFVV